MERLFQDDLISSPKASRLRATGVVTPAMESVEISFGGEDENALRRNGLPATRIPRRRRRRVFPQEGVIVESSQNPTLRPVRANSGQLDLGK